MSVHCVFSLTLLLFSFSYSVAREIASIHFKSLPNGVSPSQMRSKFIAPDLSQFWIEDENSARLVDDLSQVKLSIPEPGWSNPHTSIRRIEFLKDDFAVIETSGNQVAVIYLPHREKTIYSRESRRLTEYLPKSQLLIFQDTTAPFGPQEVFSLNERRVTAKVTYSNEMAFSADQETLHTVKGNSIEVTNLVTGRMTKKTLPQGVMAGTSLDQSFLMETQDGGVTLTAIATGEKRSLPFKIDKTEKPTETRLRHNNSLLFTVTWDQSTSPATVRFRSWDTRNLDIPTPLPVLKSDSNQNFQYTVNDELLAFHSSGPRVSKLSLVSRTASRMIYEEVALDNFGLLTNETLVSPYLPPRPNLLGLYVRDKSNNYVRFILWDIDKNSKVKESPKYFRADVARNKDNTRILLSHVTHDERAVSEVLDAETLNTLGHHFDYRVKNVDLNAEQELVILRRVVEGSQKLPHQELALDLRDGGTVSIPEKLGPIQEMDLRSNTAYFLTDRFMGKFSLSP